MSVVPENIGHGAQTARISKRRRTLLWVLVGLAVAIVGLGVVSVVVVVVSAASSFGSERNLSDFASPAEARAFTSAHLPVPLAQDAVIEQLHYERWTDWNFSARVRLPTADAADSYLEQAKRERKLDDAYCLGHQDPTRGARYALTNVHACGSIQLTSPQVIEVHCSTR